MRLSILLFFLILLPAVSSPAERLYHVGNSHTVDIKPHAEFRTMVESQGDTILNDWHINCGASLDRIYNNPTQVCIGSELWPDAFSNPEWGGWDAIILQPFQAPPNPAITESTAAINLIQYAITNLPNADATYYIFATWPKNTSPGNLENFDYAAAYLQPFTDENTDSVAQQREFYIYLMKALADAGLGVTIKPIPVSEVLYNFDIRARAGGVPGYVSAGDIYRDTLHMDWPGVYLAALTTYAVVYDVDPRTVGVVPEFFGVTAGQAAAIGEVIYETLEGPVFSVGPDETNVTIEVALPGNAVELSFKTFTGYEYDVLASPDLATWAPATGTIQGNSQVVELDLSSTDNSSYFKVIYDPPNLPVSKQDLELWLRADAGVIETGGGVSQWRDQSGNGRHASQPTPASQPTLMANAVMNAPALNFDGVDDFLTFNLPLNGLTDVTLVLVSSNAVNQDPGWEGPLHSPLFWNEVNYWSTVHLTPFQTQVRWSYGTGQSQNLPEFVRPSSIGQNFSITIAIKDGTNEHLYVDGSLVRTEGGKLATLDGVQDTGNLGRGYDFDTFFNGKIAEVLVYTRALDATERAQLESYLLQKYLDP